MLRSALVLVCLFAAAAPSRAQPTQPPWKGENLQFYPNDISRDQLTQRMREF